MVSLAKPVKNAAHPFFECRIGRLLGFFSSDPSGVQIFFNHPLEVCNDLSGAHNP
jgi:hypothetical protein